MQKDKIVNTIADKLTGKYYKYNFKLSGLVEILYFTLEGLKCARANKKATTQTICFYQLFKYECIKANPETERDFEELEKAVEVDPTFDSFPR